MTKLKAWRRAAMTLATIGLTILAAPASADEFYKGKTVSLYVGATPGGANDVAARLVGAHIGRHLGGNPNVLVKNLPGAGGRKLATYLYSVSPRDGTEFANLQRGILTETLLDSKIKNPFDVLKFTWIGSPQQEMLTCVVWHTAKIQTLEDLTTKEFLVAASNSSGGETMISTVLNALAGTRLKAIVGYSGGGEMNLAMQRGEVDGRCGLGWGAIKTNYTQWLRDKEMKVLVQFSQVRSPDLPDTPSVYDLLKSDDDRAVLDLILATQRLGRPFAGPPSLPADRTAALRKAFDAMVRDPEFTANAERQKVDLQPLSGPEIDEVLKRAYATPPRIVARAAKLSEGSAP